MKHNIDHTQCRTKLMAMEDALYVIGGKWKLKVLLSLEDGAIRFNELQRRIGGISAKVLSSELKDLEENGFVTRKIYTDQFPVVVEYERTDYSYTLNEVIKTLVVWGEMHQKKVREMHLVPTV